MLQSGNSDQIRCCVLILVRKCSSRHLELIRQSTANLLGVEGVVVGAVVGAVEVDGDVRVEVREEWRLIEVIFFAQALRLNLWYTLQNVIF